MFVNHLRRPLDDANDSPLEDAESLVVKDKDDAGLRQRGRVVPVATAGGPPVLRTCLDKMISFKCF